MRSKDTNRECSGLFNCRLYLFRGPNKFRGILYQGYIYHPYVIIYFNVVFTRNFTRKKNGGVLSQGDNYNCLLFQIHQSLFHGGVFCHRDIFKQGDFILPNRSIAFFKAEYFVTGIYLKRVISYDLIDQSRFFKGHFDLGYSVPGLFYTC